MISYSVKMMSYSIADAHFSLLVLVVSLMLPLPSIPPSCSCYCSHWLRATVKERKKERMYRLRAGNIAHALPVPGMSRLFIRDSCSKLFVGGLSYDTNEPVLKDAFEEHGAIVEVKVICDRRTGKSKGYGFVQFSSESEADSALQKMDGQLLDGRNIRVHYANSG